MALQQKYKIVTTSWDDGYIKDVYLAELLDKYRLSGTFYIPINAPKKPAVDNNQIREIADRFEVGGHTINHVNLKSINIDQAKYEISTCKEILEDVVGTEMNMFCFPKGNFNKEIIRIVIDNGFKYARTTKSFRFSLPNNSQLMHTSIQAYPHSAVSHVMSSLKRKDFKAIKFIIRFKADSDWKNLAKRMFDYVVSNGGVWHLWGHSWEIEKLGLWEDLEEVFTHICNVDKVQYLSNFQAMKHCHT